MLIRELKISLSISLSSIIELSTWFLFYFDFTQNIYVLLVYDLPQNNNEAAQQTVAMTKD